MNMASPRPSKTPILLVGLLLIGQALFLFAVFPTVIVIDFLIRPEAHMAMFFPESGGFVMPQVEVESPQSLDILFHFPEATITIPGNEVASLAFSSLALPMLLIGLIFLGGRRFAWVLAVFMQALILSLTLVGYFAFRHPYIYIVMVYSIFMVFYLNHYEIQASFRTPPASTATAPVERGVRGPR